MTEEAAIGSDEESVTLFVQEKLINKDSSFLIEVFLPVPLNKGC